MFLGRYEHAINGQGRTSLPVKFREELKVAGEDRLIITNREECLVAYPPSAWRRVMDYLKNKPQTDKHYIEYKRFFISGAQECLIDKQGRILIPPILRDHAGLTKEIIFAGMQDEIEIWSKEKWEAEFKKDRNNFSDNSQFLAGLGS
jgi:MraZ protein